MPHEFTTPALLIVGMFSGWVLALKLAKKSDFLASFLGMALGAAWGIARMVETSLGHTLVACAILLGLLALRVARMHKPVSPST